MEEGFVLDYTHGARVQSEWVQGAPEKSRWGTGVKLKGRLKVPVATYRCTKCGYLESYAPVA
jgi:hypothetical protein